MIGIIKHEPTCKEGYELKEGKCIGTERVPASATCSGSSYNSSTGLCESFVYVSDVVINEDDEETCPSGGSISIGNKGKGCYQTTTSAPKYSCKKGKLEGNECVIESGSKEPTLEVVCDKGLTKYKDVACLDYHKKSDYITGYTCKSGARLEKDKCVYYKVVAAKQK